MESLQATVLIFTPSTSDVGSVLSSARQVPGLEFVGAVRESAELLPTVLKTRPEVVLIHLTSYAASWADLVTQIRGLEIVRGIVVLTDDLDNGQIVALLKAGTNAILPPSASASDLTTGIREALNDGLYIPPRPRNRP